MQINHVTRLLWNLAALGAAGVVASCAESTGSADVEGFDNGAIFSPSRSLAMNFNLSSIGLHSFQGIRDLPQMP